jgi:hypothetical protein
LHHGHNMGRFVPDWHRRNLQRYSSAIAAAANPMARATVANDKPHTKIGDSNLDGHEKCREFTEFLCAQSVK